MTKTPGPLAGVRVIELAGINLPVMCTFADPEIEAVWSRDVAIYMDTKTTHAKPGYACTVYFRHGLIAPFGKDRIHFFA